MLCVEDAVTWVPSGRWISLFGPVPVAVLDAPRVSGFHLAHIEVARIGADVVAKILRNEPVGVLAAMVHVPAGVAPSLEAAQTSADQLGLPTLVRAPRLLGLSDSRVVPFHAYGEVGAALVMPAEHLASLLYRRTEKWAREQLGSYDPAVADPLRYPPKMTDIEPAGHIARGKPEEYAAALRRRTAWLTELVRQYDAALIPPGPRQPGSSRQIVGARLDSRGPLHPVQERDDRGTHPAEPEAVRLVAVGTMHVVVRQVTTGGRRQFVLVSDQEWAELAGRGLVPPGRAPTLMVHSVTGGDVRVPVRYADGTEGTASLEAPDLAMIMKTVEPDADSWVFASCAAGADDGGFAARLADALEDRAVLAPQGDVSVGANIPGGLSTWQGTSWRLFVPGESSGEDWDVVNDPEGDGRPFDGITALSDESNSGLRLGLQQFKYALDFSLAGIHAGTSDPKTFNTSSLRCFRISHGGSIIPSLIFPGPADGPTDFLWDLRPATGNTEEASPPIADKTRFVITGPQDTRIGIPCPWGDDKIYIVKSVIEHQHALVQVSFAADRASHSSYRNVWINAASLAQIVKQDSNFMAAYSRGVRSILLQGPASRRFASDFRKALVGRNNLDIAVYFPTQPLTFHSDGPYRRAEVSKQGYWDVLSTTMPISYFQSVVAELAQTSAIGNWGYPEPQAIGPNGISVTDRYRAHKAVRQAIRLSFDRSKGVLNVDNLLTYADEQRLVEKNLILRAAIAHLLADRSTPLRALYAVDLNKDRLPMPAAIVRILGERLERSDSGKPRKQEENFTLTLPVKARRNPLPMESEAAIPLSPFWPNPKLKPGEIKLSDQFAWWQIDRMARWLAAKIAEGGSLIVQISTAGGPGSSAFRTSLQLTQRVREYLEYFFDLPGAEQIDRQLRIDYTPKDSVREGTTVLSVVDRRPAPPAPAFPPSAVLRVPENARCLLTAIAIAMMPPSDHLRLLEGGDYTNSESAAARLKEVFERRVESVDSDEMSSTLQHVLRNTERARNAPGGADAYLASADDIDALKAAVAKWDDNWTGEFGEAFVHLVSHILRMPIRIHDMDHPEGRAIVPFGPATLSEVSVWRESDTHYDAWAPHISLSGPPMLLTPAITADGNVYAISSRKISAPQSLMSDLIDASGTELPVILLADPGIAGAANGADIAELNVLLEQFAQCALRPVVVTRSRPSLKLLDMAATYGLAVLHPVWDKSSNSGKNDKLQFEPQWQATRRGLRGGPELASTPGSPWRRIDQAVLQAVAGLARPEAAINPVDSGLRHMIWAPTIAESQEAFAKLRRRWSSKHLITAQAQIEQMIGRINGQSRLGIFASVLEVGALGDSKTVFDYAAAAREERPEKLMTAVTQIREVEHPGSSAANGLTSAALERMVTAVDDTDSFSLSVLRLIRDIEAGHLDKAEAFIVANRRKLSWDERDKWLVAIADLSKKRPHLRSLGDAIYDCGPAL
ncbi:hypothetical protein [Micromonospora sp. NPDC049102]|uniref:hypothetical protein n=1 Tax=Micromonospora sp. NPDC049102 TaxID=3364265 RepID=UPI003717E288